MLKRSLIIILIGGTFLFIGALVLVSQKSQDKQQAAAKIFLKTETLTAAILDTPTAKQKGLSGQDKLAPHQAVLMIFPEPGEYGIWMPNMKFPIDVIWLDQNQQIVHLEPNVTPDSYPQTFYPNKPAQLIIEANIKTIENNHLQLGDKIIIKKD